MKIKSLQSEEIVNININGPKPVNVSFARSWSICGINPVIVYLVLCHHVFG
jgi:hypothetical protein